MHRELKRVSTLILLMFLALFTSTTVIQAVEADQLHDHAWNVRSRYDQFSVERGSIIVAGEAIARSTPVSDQYRYQREYPEGSRYAHITGYFTLDQGNTGLEASLNRYLVGQSDAQFLDRLLATITGGSNAGATVELTINPKAQEAAQRALGGRRGAVVAIEPDSGRILALYSNPSFDPNTLAVHNSKQVIEEYERLLANDDDPLINRAISGDLYAPGSTFKLVVAAAALENGYSANTELDNPVRLQLPLSTSTISNYNNARCGSNPDKVTIATAMMLSCNVPFAELGIQLGDDVIRKYAKAFGFDASPDFQLPVTASTYPADIDEAQTALTAIGQFDVRATPLQMAQVSAGIANNGLVMQPTIVERILRPDFRELVGFTASEQNRAITVETSDILTRMMVANVNTGVASGARMEGVTVAGKTGTAQGGTNQALTYWFTGFAPAENPKIAIAVVVEGHTGEAGTGGGLAAPIAKRVMEAVLR